ncbi:MAG: ATP synthase subunit I [Myxococcales bacterium]|nr:MAG: ATP synthase subunit I [Myxococcales bacterium]
MPRTDEDSGLRAALWAVAITGALFTAASPFVLGKGAPLGVAIGAFVAAFNLWALARIVRAFMNGAGLPWVLLAAFKLVGLLALVALVLKLEVAAVVPLAVGYVALPVGIVFAQLGNARSRAVTAPETHPGIEPDSGPMPRDGHLKG